MNINKENKNDDYAIKEIENKIDNNQNIENNTFLNKKENIDDMVDRIEAMNVGVKNSSKGFNQNNENYNNINVNINIESENERNNNNDWSLDKNSNGKIDESDSIDKLVNFDKKESNNNSQKSFENNFDDD